LTTNDGDGTFDVAMALDDDRLRLKKLWDELSAEAKRHREAYEASWHDGSSAELRELLHRAYVQASDRWVEAVAGPPPSN
jgi:hypothetical protein